MEKKGKKWSTNEEGRGEGGKVKRRRWRRAEAEWMNGWICYNGAQRQYIDDGNQRIFKFIRIRFRSPHLMSLWVFRARANYIAVLDWVVIVTIHRITLHTTFCILEIHTNRNSIRWTSHSTLAYSTSPLWRYWTVRRKDGPSGLVEGRITFIIFEE